jgi:hypothetical protein
VRHRSGSLFQTTIAFARSPMLAQMSSWCASPSSTRCLSPTSSLGLVASHSDIVRHRLSLFRLLISVSCRSSKGIIRAASYKFLVDPRGPPSLPERQDTAGRHNDRSSRQPSHSRQSQEEGREAHYPRARGGAGTRDWCHGLCRMLRAYEGITPRSLALNARADDIF